MRTDKEIFRIFRTLPNWIFELTDLPSPGKSRFQSVVVKALERRTDGVNMPDDVEHAISVVEIQFQKDESIYTRIVTEMAQIQQDNNWREVQGIILFRNSSIDPKTKPWTKVVHAFVFDELLKRFEAKHPHHPLVAVFKPVFAEDEHGLASQAGDYYRDIRQSTLDEHTKTTLAEVFLSWLVQRFKHKSRKEIEAMIISELTDLEDTMAGKELIALGEERGEKRGEERGEQLGKEEAMRNAILVLLQSNGVVPPEDVHLQIASLNYEQMLKLLPLVAKWTNLEPLRTWLAGISAT